MPPSLAAMQVIRTLRELDRAGASIAGGVLVPTMGALHKGHAALIRRGRQLSAATSASCVVSIFVNPTQFNDPRDYEWYPRTEEADLALCREAGASAAFVPAADQMYPPGDRIEVPSLPPVATGPRLEDARRPGHFAGVCQVVLRLFRLLHPAAAVFGEKDWQQLRVVAEMVSALGLPIRIEPHATVREPDGLAMSSRNRLLSRDERGRATAISHALCEAAGKPDPAAAEQQMASILARAGLDTEYAVVRDAGTLLKPVAGRSARALIAAKAGSVRLIDNAPWTPV